MFYLSYKITLKNIVRSPAAVLGLVGGIIFMLVNGISSVGSIDMLTSESMRFAAYAQAISGNHHVFARVYRHNNRLRYV